MKKLSVLIVEKNEAKLIEDCFASLKFFDDFSIDYEVVVIDDNSTDATVAVAKKHGAIVIEYHGNTFADKRNKALKEVSGQWVFYIDADERLTKKLASEMADVINNDSGVAYAIPRQNVIFGKVMTHGGWWPDYVKRFFLMSSLSGWKGDLHEEPIFEGELGHLNNYMVHFKHDTLTEMVDKTNSWSEIEAKLLFEAGHPKMVWWRFFRIMVTELFYRLIIKMAFLDGPEGVIYAIYQSWSRFVTYSKLWEMQVKASGE